MQEAWRKYLGVALGVTETSREKAGKVVRKLVGRGGATADQLQTLTNDLLAAGSANREGIAKLVRFEVDKALGRVGLATVEEVTQLTARVRELEAELRRAQASTSPISEAAQPVPAAAPEAVPAAAPEAAREAPRAAKKVARKSAAKKVPGASEPAHTVPPVAAPPLAAPPVAAPPLATSEATVTEPPATTGSARAGNAKATPGKKAGAKKAPTKAQPKSPGGSS